LALDGLEACVKEAAPKRRPKTASRSKVHVIRYADDVVATARTREMLEDHVIPAITSFLQERGLRLSQEKSRIVHIADGFDFLGAHLRKYKGKFLMRPTQANVIAIARDLKSYIRNRRGTSQEHLIHQVNRRLRGWANAFRHLVSSRAFRHIDNCVYGQLWRWACKRHGKKGKRWVWHRYYRRLRNGSWIFASQAWEKTVVLFRARDLRIRRHIKIRSAATLYDPAYEAYFKERQVLQRNSRQRDYYQWLDRKQLELEWVS
jgi:RNA-directed DNA polymerase